MPLPRKRKRPPLKVRMKASLTVYRQLVLRPLRLIHPEHNNDPTYRTCYERFFRVTGIVRTKEILEKVSRMPSPLRVQSRYKKLAKQVEIDNDSKDFIEGPSEEAMQRIDNIVNTLKPLHFFEDEETCREMTEEDLLDGERDDYQATELD